MALIAGKGLTQNTDNCFIHTKVDSNNVVRPVAAVGQIFRQGTGDRGEPPKCVSAFECAGTPFDRGHIMALELGGPDITENIVPQYGMWQQNARGAWRKMEKAIYDASATTEQVMVVSIEYDDNAQGTYDAQLSAFSGGDKLFHWTDKRIPTRFRVWALADNWAGTAGNNAVSLAAYFAADATGKDAAIDSLITALSGNGGPATKISDKINAMPAIDREYWRQQMVRAEAKERYELYVAALRAASANQMAAAVNGSGPIRTRHSTRATRNNPYARPTETEMTYSQWLTKDQNQNLQVVADRFKANTSNCAKGWTGPEMQSMTLKGVTNFIFQSV
jgi:hypothetical protein